jgi:hypothetical protein
MARKSAAARAAEAWKVGIGHPPPRRGMKPAAQKIWIEIVEARPAAFFLPGATHLLRTYCEVSAVLEQLGPELAQTPEDDQLLERVAKLTRLQSTLAQKLRLSIQTAMRIENAAVVERLEPAKAKAPALLAGKAGWRAN